MRRMVDFREYKGEVFQTIMIGIAMLTLTLPWLYMQGREVAGLEIMADILPAFVIAVFGFLLGVWNGKRLGRIQSLLVKGLSLFALFLLSGSSVGWCFTDCTPFFMIWVVLLIITGLVSVLMSTRIGADL